MPGRNGTSARGLGRQFRSERTTPIAGIWRIGKNRATVDPVCLGNAACNRRRPLASARDRHRSVSLTPTRVAVLAAADAPRCSQVNQQLATFSRMRRRKHRFEGAGGSATREFNRQRRQNIREDWRVWLAVPVAIVGFAAWSLLVNGVAARALAAMAGILAGVMFVLWSLGGHVAAFRWWLGAEGERDTGSEIEKLGPEWHCEHDLEHERGNWDHVLVGPAGVFLLDSKRLHGTAAVGGDALRSGRLAYPGGAFRAGAKRIKEAMELRLGSRAPWVQAVVVVWGAFPQARHDEQDVVYLSGDELRPWLSELPERLNAPQRASLVTALREVRASLSASDRST
jgi:hypothetical protein